MKKIAYLFGAGSTHGEACNINQRNKLLMSDINHKVFKKSEKLHGPYSKFIKNLYLDSNDINIEHIITLIGENLKHDEIKLKKLKNEIKTYFQQSILDVLYKKSSYMTPKLSISLIMMHQKYAKDMGEHGEELSAILTLNLDSMVDRAFEKCYNAINYGDVIEFGKKMNSNVPKLLKLHGSFNWELKNNSDHIVFSPQMEFNINCENSCWITPSAKKDLKSFDTVWHNADNVLSKIDVLRIVGCALRIEDWKLLSTVFKAQYEKNKKFEIELIMPEKDSKNILEKITFLSKMRGIEKIYKSIHSEKNTFKSYVLAKYNEATDKNLYIKDDKQLMRYMP